RRRKMCAERVADEIECRCFLCRMDELTTVCGMFNCLFYIFVVETGETIEHPQSSAGGRPALPSSVDATKM
ncbi:MAG: hypothetical protein ABJO88_13795, partial [Parasphingorhabdus sp.]